MNYTLPKLDYSYEALEPHIDAKTMELHYSKHHQTYVDKLNAVLAKHPELAERSLEELLKGLNGLDITEADKKVIRNHGGGHLNHSFFWSILGPTKQINEQLVAEITTTFGSIEEFKKQFNEVATATFGSGWAWLVRDEAGKLQVYSTPNQDSPLMQKHTPIIGLDVWEHAYYLKYQNKRPDYINAWWNVLKLF